MLSLVQTLTGCWRSLRIYRFSGKVEAHGAAVYNEWQLDENGTLSFRSFPDRRQDAVFAPGQWRLENSKRRWFVYFGNKQAFEVITAEADNLVLADPVKGEKIFFAPLAQWAERVGTSSNTQSQEVQSPNS